MRTCALDELWFGNDEMDGCRSEAVGMGGRDRFGFLPVVEVEVDASGAATV